MAPEAGAAFQSESALQGQLAPVAAAACQQLQRVRQQVHKGAPEHEATLPSPRTTPVATSSTSCA
eukprot:14999161-Alexandrium_andersonii.AAC.1